MSLDHNNFLSLPFQLDILYDDRMEVSLFRIISFIYPRNIRWALDYEPTDEKKERKKHKDVDRGNKY